MAAKTTVSATSTRRRDGLLYYGMQLVVLAVPILLMPFYGRVLGAAGFGVVSQGQAFAAIVAMIVDYGFQISAVRNVTACRGDTNALGRLLSEVLGAKLLMAAIVVALSVITLLIIPGFREDPRVYVSSLLLGLMQGFSFYWFFGGCLAYAIAGGLEVGARLLAAVLVLLFVRDADEAWLVQALFAGSAAVFVGVGLALAYRRVPFFRFSLAGSRRMLMNGRHIFTIAVVGTVYTAANPLLLGIVASAEAVGFFSAAEKLLKIVTVPFSSLRQIFFPIISSHIATDKEAGWRMMRQLLFASTSCAAVAAVLLVAFAPQLVTLVFGAEFLPSAPVLQLLAGVPVLLAVTEALGTMWLLPNGFDRAMTRITVITTVMHTGCLLVLGIVFAEIGAGVVTLGSQALACVLVVSAVRSISRSRHEPASSGTTS